ncbi:MAG: hypothetical protein HY829_10650 [Actinobacteria bacterium]|nr:hypothetical protein [Actinomycetota bacterium]
MTLSRADTARRSAHVVTEGRYMRNSWSGTILATCVLWDVLHGEPGRCDECLWIVREWGHNPDCPRRSKRQA